ncbi:carbohydrate ABC transporter permease [Paenibacillus sepulcri]|uniref:ABC transporter permease subunit n=1 Tax=Paenibacillus sepulcri TaxID=359917 RepID=A0ABS7C0M9_9BACL|nr:ABC transporter permease subunit [Paenibacillus sepulcri]
MVIRWSWFTLLNYFFLGLFAFCTLYPFIYIAAYSLNEGIDAMQGGIHFWPRKFTLENYREIFKDTALLNAYKITLLRTVIGTLLHVSLCMLAAYALSRRKLPGRNFFTFFIFIPSIFNAGFIPLFIVLQKLGLFNTFWVYILPFLFNFFHIIIMRTFLEQLPEEMIESAKIDGYGDLRIFLRIIVPLSGPVLAVVSIFIGVFHWNDWFTGSYFVSNKDLIPVQTLLQNLLTQSEAFLNATRNNTNSGGGTTEMSMQLLRTTPESLRMAILVTATLPILCIYPFFQKHFVKGAMLGSIKG